MLLRGTELRSCVAFPEDIAGILYALRDCVRVTKLFFETDLARSKPKAMN